MILLLWACAWSGENSEQVDEFSAGFYGQNHQITTYSIDDQCFDGAMQLLFMPEGEEVPQEFQYPVYVPSLDELPMTYEISLREPFIGMVVTATDSADGKITIGDAQMEEVSLGATFGECKATMEVDADIVPAQQEFDIRATVTMSELRGDDQGCPVPLTETCQVILYMTAVPWSD